MFGNTNARIIASENLITASSVTAAPRTVKTRQISTPKTATNHKRLLFLYFELQQIEKRKTWLIAIVPKYS